MQISVVISVPQSIFLLFIFPFLRTCVVYFIFPPISLYVRLLARYSHQSLLLTVSWWMNGRSLPWILMRICHRFAGMERLQFAVERVRVRRSEGPADNTNETMEAGRVNVQQVSSFDSLFTTDLRHLIVVEFATSSLTHPWEGPCLIKCRNNQLISMH